MFLPAEAYLNAGPETGLANAFEYGMLRKSGDPAQEYDLLLIEQMTPTSEFYTKSARRSEWKTFIDGKCDRAKLAPIVPGN